MHTFFILIPKYKNKKYCEKKTHDRKIRKLNRFPPFWRQNNFCMSAICWTFDDERLLRVVFKYQNKGKSIFKGTTINNNDKKKV